jgi:hypothetical protein
VAFLGLGDGAALWLTEAAAAGAARVRAKMGEAVELARLHGDTVVDRALGQAGLAGRFAEGDLAAILTHQATALPGPAGRAGEDHTLAQGTGPGSATPGSATPGSATPGSARRG